MNRFAWYTTHPHLILRHVQLLLAAVSTENPAAKSAMRSPANRDVQKMALKAALAQRTLRHLVVFHPSLGLQAQYSSSAWGHHAPALLTSFGLVLPPHKRIQRCSIDLLHKPWCLSRKQWTTFWHHVRSCHTNSRRSCLFYRGIAAKWNAPLCAAIFSKFELTNKQKTNYLPRASSQNLHPILAKVENWQKLGLLGLL